MRSSPRTWCLEEPYQDQCFGTMVQYVPPVTTARLPGLDRTRQELPLWGSSCRRDEGAVEDGGGAVVAELVEDAEHVPERQPLVGPVATAVPALDDRG